MSQRSLSLDTDIKAFVARRKGSNSKEDTTSRRGTNETLFFQLFNYFVIEANEGSDPVTISQSISSPRMLKS